MNEHEILDQEKITPYLPLVKNLAGRLHCRVPKTVEFDDLVGYGVLGLVEAMKEFDPAKRVKFSTYAFYRIRGAMLDGLRSLDTLSRGMRRRVKEVAAVSQDLSGTLGRDPYEEEVAAKVHMSVEDVRSLLAEAKDREIVALEEEIQKRISVTEPMPNQPEVMEHKELLEGLTEGLRLLEEKERLVLTLYYYEELTLKEIGAVLHVSESRVSQLLSRATAELRKKIEYIRVEL